MKASGFFVAIGCVALLVCRGLEPLRPMIPIPLTTREPKTCRMEPAALFRPS